MLTYDPCPRCDRPLVAVRSREAGLCSGCIVELDKPGPVEAGQVKHEPACRGGQITRHELVRRAVLICGGCGAFVSVPRRTAWQEADR